jgi:hypothetical protein
MAAILAFVLMGTAWWMSRQRSEPTKPHVIVVQTPGSASTAASEEQPRTVQMLRPDIYPEPVSRLGLASGFPAGLIPLASRGPATPYQQVGILTAEGGSSSSASPDRTILPLYGRELDSRRGRWNYYTRTDGVNPVQVPVRVRNRICDDDTNGCDEVSDGDGIHVPALGRAFKATVYRRSIFG